MRLLTLVTMVMLASGCDSPSRPSDPNPRPPSGPIGFSLTGLVNDTVGRPVADVRVEVLDGPRAGLTTTTSIVGQFTLDNVADVSTATLTVKATRAGYAEQVTVFRNILRQPLLVFMLESEHPPLDLTGAHLVTFIADSACTTLPSSARTRTYRAEFEERQSHHYVELHGGTFHAPPPMELGLHSTWSDLFVSLFEDIVAVDTGGDAGIWEHLTADSYVTITGRGIGSLANPPHTLMFEGTFAYCGNMNAGNPAEPECRIPPVICTSKHHTVELARSNGH